MGPAPNDAKGAVYDLAYQRYDGARTGHALRFVVIARQAIVAQIRQRAVRALLVLGLLSLAFGAAVVLLMGVGIVPTDSGDASSMMDSFIGRGSVWGQTFAVFLLVLVCGAPAVAADLNAGAFQFYFARPVSRAHYLAARLLSAGAWSLVLCVLTLAVVTAEYALLGPSVAHALALAARAAGPMTLRIAALASVATGLSSLTRRRGLAQALYAGVVAGVWMLTHVVAGAVHAPWVLALGVTGAAEALAEQTLGLATEGGWHAAVPALASGGWIVGGIALASWRLARAEVVRG